MYIFCVIQAKYEKIRLSFFACLALGFENPAHTWASRALGFSNPNEGLLTTPMKLAVYCCISRLEAFQSLARGGASRYLCKTLKPILRHIFNSSKGLRTLAHTLRTYAGFENPAHSRALGFSNPNERVAHNPVNDKGISSKTARV